MSIKNLIFDWSGTLVDDSGPTLDATNVVFGRYGLPAFSWEDFQKSFRLPYPEFYEEFLPEVPIDELELHFRKAFNESEAGVTLLQGAKEVLEKAKQMGGRLFILSSMDQSTLEAQAREFGLIDYFEVIYASVIDKRITLEQMLIQHALVPEETVFLGDMVHDIRTAQHCGVTSMGLLTGYDPAARLQAENPDYLFPSLTQVIKHLGSNSLVSQGGGLVSRDQIRVRRLEVWTHIGVPEEEREEAQKLLVDLEITPKIPFNEQEDEIERTVDYYAATREVIQLGEQKPRKLIETLAVEIAEHLLAKDCQMASIKVSIEKMILDDAQYVGVSCCRGRFE